MKITHGQRYRYCPNGEIRSHRGLVGVASNVESLSAVTYSCTLSNIAEWGALGIATQITAMSYELEAVELDIAALKVEGAKLREATERSRRVREDLAITPADLGFHGAESDLVQAITDALTHQGYLVCVVGQARAKGSGTTVGYPDMSFRRAEWPRGLVCLVEVKTATGSMEPEQETLHAGGWSFVVRSVAGAISVLTQFENDVFAATKAESFATHNPPPAAAGKGNY